ncbi:hypothetical protein RND71_042095 [Anisodus tanguticus]|uniref:Protein FLX-like 4 n=1 Tax=Anisodus tanguticus TaxID=243964 RepID=A0AAE1QRX3_9SOLA|nr:hypothetical protein RND71_042095 [Anisodus tanguticus]
MASRRQIPAPYGRSLQAPGMVLHEELPAGRHRDNRLAAELEQLAGDNHRLAATYVALKQDLSAAHREVEKLKEHIRSSQTESDIQIRLLLDKIAKMDQVDLRSVENLRKDVEEAHLEARSLVTANMELSGKIHHVMQELEKARADVKKLPEMHAELDSLKKEHQKLRKTFQHEKGLNIEKVEQMKLMEKDLIGMANEVERLCAEVLIAEKRAQGFDPYGRPYMNSDPMHPAPPMHHVDGYQRPHIPGALGAMGEGSYPYGSGVAASVQGGAGTPPGNVAAWGGSHDAPQARS